MSVLAAAARDWAFVTIGLAAGFTGLAVVATIVTGLPLRLFEAALGLIPIGAAIVVLRRAPAETVREVARVARAGLAAGLIATLVYDVSRTGLSLLDPSPYNPFEAVRHFGMGIVGREAPAILITTTGMGIHFLNGMSFGVIYALFAGRHLASLRGALAAGVAWGLTLEFLQSILYPGWLQITTVLNEFLLISGAGHFLFGATLGVGVRWLLFGRSTREERGHA